MGNELSRKISQNQVVLIIDIKRYAEDNTEMKETKTMNHVSLFKIVTNLKSL